MDRGRYRLPVTVAIALAFAVAGLAVLALQPEDGLVEPVAVSPEAYFSDAQIERARDYRRPQLVLYGLALAVQLGVLVLFVRRPPRRLLDRLPAARPVLAAGIVGAVVVIAMVVARLPLSAIARERAIDVGLVTRSWPGWAGDVLMGLAISVVIAAAGFALAVWLRRRLPRAWWVVGSVVVVAAGAVYTFATPLVVDPLFNDFEELPAGPLRADVLALADEAGVDVGEVLVMDASKRTTAANAYVAGLGATKRVVLYDTLVENFPRDEVRLVVAHELAHVRFDDLPTGLLFLAIVAPFGFYAAARLTEHLAPTGARGPEVVPALALSVAVVAMSILWISNAMSREIEARADAYALELTDEPRTFIDYRVRSALRNITDPRPPELAHTLLWTHPTTMERIGIAEAFARRGGG